MRPHATAAFPAALTLLIGVGCSNAPPTPPPARKAASPAAPTKTAGADDPLVREARADTEPILNDLLAGRTGADPGLARRAEQARRYTSWTIDGQEVESRGPVPSVRFDGTFHGPPGRATFHVSMAKQRDGRWMVGWFQGPDPLRP